MSSRIKTYSVFVQQEGKRKHIPVWPAHKLNEIMAELIKRGNSDNQEREKFEKKTTNYNKTKHTNANRTSCIYIHLSGNAYAFYAFSTYQFSVVFFRWVTLVKTSYLILNAHIQPNLLKRQMWTKYLNCWTVNTHKYSIICGPCLPYKLKILNRISIEFPKL